MKQFIPVVISLFILNNLFADDKDDFAIYNIKAINTRDIGHYDSSFVYLHSAIKEAKDFQDSIIIYISFSRTYYKLTDYYTAKFYLDSALEITNQRDFKDYKPYIYHNLGLIFTETGEFKTGLKYLHKALKEIPDNAKGYVLNDIGRCYWFIGDVDSSNYFLRKAYNFKLQKLGINNYSTLSTGLELYRNTNNKKLLERLGESIFAINNQYLLGRYYFSNKEYEKAEKYFSNDWFKLLQIYNESEQYVRAITALDSVRNSYSNIESKLFLQSNERLIYKKAIDEVITKDTTEAFKLALKSRGNLLRDDLRNKLSDFPPSYNYFDFDSVIYLFHINNQRISFYRIQVDTLFLENYDGFLYNLDIRNIRNSYYKGYRDYCETAYYLYKTLLPEVDNKITIIPDGKLHYIPFEALLTSIPDTTKPNFKTLPYLMKTSTINYDYILQEHKASQSKNRINLMVPDTRLVFSQKIIKKIKKYKSYIYNGKSAKYDKIKKGSILHIEAHYKPEENFIRLADTILIIENLEDLKKELVVIATCYSGIGKNYKGEGVFSPGRYFFKAGAKSIIESIWESDGESSYIMLTEFYKQLNEGKTKSFALNKGKQKYLKECRHSRAHPYYWAHMRLFGNDTPLLIEKKKHILIILLGVIIIIMCLKYFVRFKRKQTP